jgi:hypothetical protein
LKSSCWASIRPRSLRPRQNSGAELLTIRVRGFPSHARRVAPEIFEAVELAFLAAEDMDDDLHVIDHDPLARREAVHRNGLDLVLALEPAFDFARYRLQVRLGRSRANDEEIGEARDTLEIEDDDVLCLFVRGKVGAGFG